VGGMSANAASLNAFKGQHSELGNSNHFLELSQLITMADRLRKYSAGQITIQCSEGSPATGQHPRNENCHDIGEGMISSGLPVE
jgi:hypothetical protein